MGDKSLRLEMPIQLVARPRVHLARQGDGHVGVGGFAHYHQARGAGRDAQEFGLLRGGDGVVAAAVPQRFEKRK